MHTDARTLDDGSVLEGDLCIVGAGAAGISMALEWIDTPHTVLLLESGGFTVDADTQDLNRGNNLGQRYYPLQSSRLRFFGGTTGHWGGFCAPYDPIDFEQRDWVPHSGWPLTRSDLDPFYERAHEIVELGPYEYDPAYWEAQDSERVRLPFDESVIETKMWQFSAPTRFGTTYRDRIVDAENVHLVTHANVCNIEANEAVSRAEALEIRTLEGKTHTACARHYVLACGAIQNARLLLASNEQAPEGLGNDHDLVGRFFMEHLEVDAAYLMMPAPGPLQMYLFKSFVFDTEARGELALSAAQQRKHQVLNGTASLEPRERADEQPAWIERFWDDAEETLQFWDELEGSYRAGELPQVDPDEYSEYQLFTRMEQAPNPDSRVVLSEETDALGVPRADLDWRLTEREKRSIRILYEVLGREAGRSGLGRVQLMDWLRTDDPMWPSTLGGGWHHMGTTRMHENPRQGVVDAHCTVHGIDNLHVAGSAVFPTAGAANPTLTLIAMTLRLSDRLKDQVR